METVALVVLALIPAAVGYFRFRSQRKALARAFPPKPTSAKRRCDPW